MAIFETDIQSLRLATGYRVTLNASSVKLKLTGKGCPLSLVLSVRVASRREAEVLVIGKDFKLVCVL
jgi:metal-sulfur cluster biosynthetic enzyme